MHEAQMHTLNSFLTMTYDDEHLPSSKSINIEHWKLFAKKLRHTRPFRYMHCGEYGTGKGTRSINPHYHAAIFGQDWHDDRYEHEKTKQGHQLYRSPSLEKIWGHGMVMIGALTFDSAAYIARYILKKQSGPNSHEVYEDMGLDRPYSTQSRNPGIGKAWYEKYKGDLYPRDECLINGAICKPPEYYDRLLEKDDPQLHKQIKMARRITAHARRDQTTPERLQAKETILAQKIKDTLTRQL